MKTAVANHGSCVVGDYLYVLDSTTLQRLKLTEECLAEGFKPKKKVAGAVSPVRRANFMKATAASKSRKSESPKRNEANGVKKNGSKPAAASGVSKSATSAMAAALQAQ